MTTTRWKVVTLSNGAQAVETHGPMIVLDKHIPIDEKFLHQIVREHNAHAAMVEAIEQVLIASEDGGDMNDIDWKQLRAATRVERESNQGRSTV